MSTNESAESAAAYVPFDTFENFLDTLKEIGVVPDHIGRPQMSKFSGAIQTHLLASLRFLKLIGPKGETQENLDRLAKSRKTDEWKTVLASIIEPAYAPIVGDLNIKSGVLAKLREKFQQNTKYDGATLDKAIRFYLKALKATGAEISPYFFSRKTRRTSSNGRARTEQQVQTPDKAKEPNADATNAKEKQGGGEDSLIDYPLHFKGKPSGCIRVPQNLSAQDCKVIELTLAVLKQYAAPDEDDESH
jgi:hypothetical protein